MASILSFQDKFLLGNCDGTFAILNPVTGELQAVFPGRHHGRITSLAKTSNLSHFMSTSVDGLLKIWPENLFSNNDPSKKPAAWDRKSSSRAKEVDEATGSKLTFQLRPTTAVTCTATEAYQSSCIVVAGREDGMISVMQAFTLTDIEQQDIEFHMSHFKNPEEETGGNKVISCVAVSPNFNLLASAQGKTLQLWVYHSNKKGKKPPERFKTLTVESNITAIDFSANEKYILVGTEHRTLTVHYLFQFPSVIVISCLTLFFCSYLFLSLVWFGHFSHQQHLCMTLEKVDHFEMNEPDPKAQISVSLFSPSGEFVAAALTSGSIKIWKCSNWKRDEIFTPGVVWSTKLMDEDSSTTVEKSSEEEGAVSMAFGVRDDGEYIAAGTNQGNVYVWKITPQEVRKHRFSKELRSAAVIAEKVRTYSEGSDLPLLSVKFTLEAVGLVTSTEESSKVGPLACLISA